MVVLYFIECGGELSTPATGHGNFTSPNYPRAHANELMCSWIITAQVGQKIRVWFSYVSTESCCDWIIVSTTLFDPVQKINVML